MKTKLSVIALAALSCCGIVRAGESSTTFLKVKSFAFGGIGVAGTISQGEAAFRTVMERPDALEQFKVVLAKGSNEAALYALCGIRALDPASFEEAAAPLVKKNPDVETIAGCMISRQKAAGVVKNIADGRYDSHWNKK
ncbi:MAG TPA: hypothetical protein VGH65_02120 [Verrucomicrobiaceae bacterium]|jgi:hypothetical protein